MITEKKFKVPIYDYVVYVMIVDSMEEAVKKHPEIKGSMYGCTLEYDNPFCKVILPPCNNSTLIHELEHVKNIIWKWIGYTPQAGNDEPDAYLIGYLYEQVDKIIKLHLKLASKC